MDSYFFCTSFIKYHSIKEISLVKKNLSVRKKCNHDIVACKKLNSDFSVHDLRMKEKTFLENGRNTSFL